MFEEVFPIVVTSDLARALDFYRDGLGGEVSFEQRDGNGEPAYVELEFGSSRMALELGRGDPVASSARRVSICMVADEGVVDRLRVSGIEVIEPPTKSPHGERLARVYDPDGNEVVIERAPPDSARRVDEVGVKLMSPEPSGYLRVEYERRFLVSPDSRWRDHAQPYWKKFDDYYLRRSRLRLRTLMDSDTGLEFIKLTKKLESSSPYFQSTGSIPLSPYEYDFIQSLEGDRLTKQRYYHLYRGLVFSIDVFDGELSGLVLCEVETGGLEELMEIEPPEYAKIEVTEDRFFTGGSLCRTTRDELARKLSEMGVPLT